MIDLKQLNDNQKEAVLSHSYYVRIIAGAGSGKTKVLVTRIAHLIDDLGVYPNQVLAITFTNKAANEMKERVTKMLSDACTPRGISTIHSLCVRILREDILTMGYPRNFTVMDSDDQRTILKEAYKELDLTVQNYSYASMLDYISNNKTAGISFERAMSLAGGFFGEEKKAQVYEYYCKRQNKIYALDFDDLLLVTVKMFKLHNEVLRKWQNRFSHILVDEFQDIDKVQYELIGQLAGVNNHLYVVGDPDQTIYTWRGADVSIIINFEKDYKPCHTIILNENYRSVKNILNGANSLIKNNKFRVEKDLYTNKDNDEKITFYSGADESYEALWIAQKIKELNKAGKSYRDIAILYRSNYLSRAIEKGLRDENIPYAIYGGTKFYDRAEVKDALSYLRLICNTDDLSFNRIINKPKRGIGDKSVDTILECARQNDCTMYEAIRDNKLFSGKIQKTLDAFVASVERWKSIKDDVGIDELLEAIIDESGYRIMLENDNEIERLENLKELINDVRVFILNNSESTLDEYLQMVSLYGDKDKDDITEYVSLMTVHASKGLEFDTVFVCGLSDGVFPSERSVSDGRKGVEEERRIAYVAFTRAMNKLFLTSSSGFSYVLSKAKTPSRFISEISDEYLEDLNVKETFKSSTTISDVEIVITNERKEKFSKGDKVIHKLFGEGIVIKVASGIVEIAFKHPYGIKKLAAGHPSFTKVDNKLS